MADINILSKADTAQIGGNHEGNFGFLNALVALVCLILLFSAAGIFIYLQFSLSNLNSKLSDRARSVKSLRDQLAKSKSRDDILLVQGQAKAFNTLFARHLYWSKFFDDLAKNTLSTASYTALNIKGDGTLELNVTAPSYVDMDKFLQAFINRDDGFTKNFTDVELSGVTKTIQDKSTFLSFKVTMKYNTDILKYVDPNKPVTPAAKSTPSGSTNSTPTKKSQ